MGSVCSDRAKAGLAMKKARTAIDVMMIILLMMLMAYSLIGEKNHELIGLCMFALFTAHHIMNRRWWGAIFKGRYSPLRAFRTAVDVLLAVYMVMQPVSGVLMSKHILTGVALDGASADLRSIHMSFAYWGFVLLSIHVGLHAASSAASPKKSAEGVKIKAPVIIAVIVSAYGLYAFIRRGIADYLLFRVQFAYFDPSASSLLFMLDYAAIMVLIATLTYGIHKLVLHRTHSLKTKNGEEL